MIKIVALNDDEKDEENIDEEVVATREAQETIVESEYLRAIKLKSRGEVDECLHLLNELLNTKVLNEDLKSDRNDKLWIIKYNCHKNIAVILEEKFEYMLSLQHYVAATLIDNTDVFSLHKFGQLALKLNDAELAEYAFENCLERNSAHLSAAEGMLKVMNNYHNIMGLYIWAKKIYCQDPNNVKAKQILQEVFNMFKKNLSFLDERDGISTLISFDKQKDFSFEILFGENKPKTKQETHLLSELIDLKKFLLKQLNWISVGQFIVSLYFFLRDGNYSLFLVFDFNDIIAITSNTEDDPHTKNVRTHETDTKISKVEPDELEQNFTSSNDILSEQSKAAITEKSETFSLDGQNYDSDSNAKSDGCETKPKPRRRCSDLHFLEQWGWHKSRRYSSKKKTERDDLDSSLNGYLRKILMQYIFTIKDAKWPFNEECENTLDTEIHCDECKLYPSEENFQDLTKKEFKTFIQKLKSKLIDVMEVVYKWLKYVSSAWSFRMPEILKSTYIKVFEIYMSHFDLSTWNQLSPVNYEASFRICILYLELNIKNHLNINSDLWYMTFNHLLGKIGNCHLINGKGSDIYLLRLIYLEYIIHNEDNKLEECVSCLNQISDILNRMESFKLHLPNLNNTCLNVAYIQNLQRIYKRQIDINRIPTLYKKNAWDELVNIITNNIEMSKNNYDDANWLNDFCAQVKILLQSFWQKAAYDNCLIWTEKCLHYAVSHYLEESKPSIRANLFAELINFITSFIEAIILNEGFHMVTFLKKENLSRMVQNIIRILVYQFDGSYDKNSTHGQELNYKRPWVILHQLLLRQEHSPRELNTGCEDIEDTSELIPNSFLILFTAHEYLGKRQWCTNDNGEFLQYILDAVVFNLKAPIYDVCRDIIYEYLEQVTYCLFKFPPKKARSRHLEDHEASQIKLSWSKAVQVFDLYRPEELPEFNSYKLDSITSDMEQLLLKIILLIPTYIDPSSSVHHITNFIEGRCESLPTEINAFKMPYKILSLYYLLADFYFKSRDFQKAIKFYTLDLTVNPTRFDSWAGMALSKASKIETKINSLDSISVESIWKECEEVLRCFECCINLNRFQTLLWIEYGSFSYTIHSYFSRYVKNNTKNLSAEAISSIEERKNKMLTIAFNCFSLANSLQHSVTSINNEENSEDNANDEKWLCQYMLGKISEKRKEEPKIYLNHYLLAANYLYENNATYPIKINHSNPTTLSVEALEVFYRINAAIIKYLQYNQNITRFTADFFNRILKDLSNSPFAYNKAKIDGNSLNILKGKLIKKSKIQGNYEARPVVHTPIIKEEKSTTNETFSVAENVESFGMKKNDEHLKKGYSQESLTPVKPVIITNAATLSAVSSDNSTAESDSDSEDSVTQNENIALNNDEFLAGEELKNIYRMVVQNIEECATRFPEHYKSIYRLVYHYMNSPKENLDISQSEKLLLGQYKTSLGNLVNGLFYDRKTNNLFNGIWRIPSSEIDRPGSFSAHLVKCVKIFIQLLHKTNNFRILADLAINLFKTPDLDKRYITDAERKELCQESISRCTQILRSILEKNLNNKNDVETLNLLIDIYKIHKKCIKYMNQKEQIFAELLIEVYKTFISDKVDSIPENCNFLDLAIKLSVQEITAQKNIERASHLDTPTNSDFNIHQSSHSIQGSSLRSIHIPGLFSRSKFRANTQKNVGIATLTSQIQDSFNIPFPEMLRHQHLMSMLNFFGRETHVSETDAPTSQCFPKDYAKLLKSEKDVVTNTSFVNQIQDNTTASNVVGNNPMISLPNILQTTTHQVATPDSQEEFFLPVTTENVPSQMETHNSKSKGSKKLKRNVKTYNRVMDYNIALSNSNVPQKKTCNYFQTDYNNFLGVAKKLKLQYPDEFNNQQPNSSLPVNNCITVTGMKQNLESIQNDVTPLMSSSDIGLLQQSSVSPTKTLQEKLAERQKANQLIQNNLTSKITKDGNNEDIIVLD